MVSEQLLDIPNAGQPRRVVSVIDMPVGLPKTDCRSVLWSLAVSHCQINVARGKSSPRYGTLGLLLNLLEYFGILENS